ncbi:hypothetical protein FHS18_001020 [Paenibacillus phyllosphaerae]|uniref:Uncharacterized protein n=1 Tax=Paenibacillus phyllosphaerae TaxID=274593 RepID=A0A7W5AUK6_9BACL|nr:hypothetical protein [Paenibacillus phyllosphaerae]MBB3108968.1 hypothetical protein [Paenibacillus phyllosphaerae]
MPTRIHATFPAGTGTREAELKLQALRALDVQGSGDGSLSATVGDESVDLALHVIQEIGGTTETE